MRCRTFTVAAAVLALGAGAVGSALATPPSGIVSAPVLARGTLHGHAKLKVRHRRSDVVVQHVTVAPGGQTGWHTHPGPAVVVVNAGSLTVYDGDDPSCTGTTYAAGQAFIDPGRGHVHIGHNEGTENVELYITFLDVPVGGSQRIDAAAPGNCAF
jgi:quercetin dioxygenase-like cupin family protein